MENEAVPDIIRRALNPDFAMDWGFFLALVPLCLAAWLFQPTRRPGPVWWAGVVLFILFLPNAAYPLTDILHFVLKVRQRPYLPTWAVGLIVVPEYLVYIGVSLLSYVLSLHRIGSYLRYNGLPRLVLPMELTLHAASAVGIYLGRSPRLNSWDALTHPKTVLELSAGALDRGKSSLFIFGTALIIAIAYYLVGYVVTAVQRRQVSALGPDELHRLLDRSGYEVGRDPAGHLFLRRKGLDWPPAVETARAHP
jgi:uncharacterized membrane protein